MAKNISKAFLAKDSKLKIEQLCTKIATKLGVEFVELEFLKEVRGLVLSIYIDSEEGIDLDKCEKFHKELIANNIDRYDYDFLEVSSLGIDRPIKSRRDFERVAGDMVEVKLFAKVDDKKVYTGNIVDYTNEFVSLNINNTIFNFDLKNVAIIKPIIDVEAEVQAVDFQEDNEGE